MVFPPSVPQAKAGGYGRISHSLRRSPPLILGVPKETFPGERRVATVAAVVPLFAKAKLEVLVETGAGAEAEFPDAEYTAKGARIGSRDEVFASADVILQVRALRGHPG